MDQRDNVPLLYEYTFDKDIKPRVSMDKFVNSSGQMLIDTCIATGLRILNGRLGLDKGIGKTTCNTSRGSSVVDYILAQTDILKHIIGFELCGSLLLSDHSPITFRVSCHHSIENIQSVDSTVGKEFKNFSFHINRMDTFVSEVSKLNMIQ